MTRLLSTATLLAVFAALPAQADDAKRARELFDALQAKLSQAKTLKVVFRANVGPGGKELKLSGDLFFGTPGQVAYGTRGKDPAGNDLRSALISNGTEVFRWQQDTESRGGKQPAPPRLSENFRACFQKLTVLGTAFVFGLPAGTDDPFTVSGFQLGPETTTDGRTLAEIRYSVSLPQGPLGLVQVWIDTATGLPVQRRVQGNGQSMAIVEVYDALELDAEIPAGAFELPDVQEQAPAAPVAPTPPTPQPAPISPDAERARALVAKVEAKLAAAKTLRVRATILMGPPPQQVQLATVIELGEQDRVRLSMGGKVASGEDMELHVIANGTQRLTVQSAGKRAQRVVDDAAPALGTLARNALARLSPTVLLRRDAVDDPTIPGTNYRWGPQVVDGERTLQQIEFDSIAPDLPMHVTVWIDTATHLPVKRVIGDDTSAEAMTEVFQSFEFDATIDPQTFVFEGDPK